MNIAVIEDNSIMRKKITEVINNNLISNTIEYKIYSYDHAEILLKEIKNKTFHLVVLDIDLPNMDGITLAQSLYNISKDTTVIFLTSHSKYMQKAFGMNVYSYILKSEMESTLLQVLSNFVNQFLSEKSKTFNIPGGIVHICLSEILYIEYIERNPTITLINGNIIKLSSSSLKSVYRYLNSPFFLMINSHLIVNMKHISELTQKKLCLKYYDKIFAISRHKSRKIMDQYKSFLLESESL